MAVLHSVKNYFTYISVVMQFRSEMIEEVSGWRKPLTSGKPRGSIHTHVHG